MWQETAMKHDIYYAVYDNNEMEIYNALMKMMK